MINHFIHKIRSFTLLEVVVVLLLSTFFIGMVYYSIFIYLSIVKKNKAEFLENAMISQLCSNMTVESSISCYIVADHTDSLIFFIMPSGDTIKYKLQTSRVIRYQNLRIDTSFIPMRSFSFWFNGKPVKQGYVDLVSIMVGKEVWNAELVISKVYTPGVLFNQIEMRTTKTLI